METKLTQDEIDILIDILINLIPSDRIIEKKKAENEQGSLYIDLVLTNTSNKTQTMDDGYFSSIRFEDVSVIKEVLKTLEKMSDELKTK